MSIYVLGEVMISMMTLRKIFPALKKSLLSYGLYFTKSYR